MTSAGPLRSTSRASSPTKRIRSASRTTKCLQRRESIRKLASGAVLVGLALMFTACGDGTPSFCNDLQKMKNLPEITAALSSGDLERARAEAQRFKDLAATAPSEIRADLIALADSVADIIDLGEKDFGSKSEADDETTSTEEPADVEHLRKELNDRLDALEERSARVETWASTECGITL